MNLGDERRRKPGNVMLVDTDYEVIGIAAPTLAAALFNAVIYGVIIWLIYDLFIAKKVKEVPAEKGKP